MTQNGPKRPKCDPTWPQMAQNVPRMTQNGPKMTQNYPKPQTFSLLECMIVCFLSETFR